MVGFSSSWPPPSQYVIPSGAVRAGVILKVGFVCRVWKHLGRIVLPKMTGKGVDLACREEGEEEEGGSV